MAASVINAFYWAVKCISKQICLEFTSQTSYSIAWSSSCISKKDNITIRLVLLRMQVYCNNKRISYQSHQGHICLSLFAIWAQFYKAWKLLVLVNRHWCPSQSHENALGRYSSMNCFHKPSFSCFPGIPFLSAGPLSQLDPMHGHANGVLNPWVPPIPTRPLSERNFSTRSNHEDSPLPRGLDSTPLPQGVFMHPFGGSPNPQGIRIPSGNLAQNGLNSRQEREGNTWGNRPFSAMFPYPVDFQNFSGNFPMRASESDLDRSTTNFGAELRNHGAENLGRSRPGFFSPPPPPPPRLGNQQTPEPYELANTLIERQGSFQVSLSLYSHILCTLNPYFGTVYS